MPVSRESKPLGVATALQVGLVHPIVCPITWLLLRNLADYLCGMLGVGVLFSFLQYLEMIFLLCLLLLILSLHVNSNSLIMGFTS
jgi:hypothetical protein